VARTQKRLGHAPLPACVLLGWRRAFRHWGAQYGDVEPVAA